MAKPNTCCHLMPSGAICRALAAHGTRFCYAHADARRRDRRIARNVRHSAERSIPPLPECNDPVQAGLYKIAQAIATKGVTREKSDLLLYGFQILETLS